MPMTISLGGLDDPRVRALLAHHLTSARSESAPGSCHALDLEGLKAPEITLWSAWDEDTLVGVGALKRLPDGDGEIKSMHTVAARRRRGVGSAMLLHIIDAARAMGMPRLNLETGAWDYFAPARKLYRRHGFVECAPFADYRADASSIFMCRDL